MIDGIAMAEWLCRLQAQRLEQYEKIEEERGRPIAGLEEEYARLERLMANLMRMLEMTGRLTWQ